MIRIRSRVEIIETLEFTQRFINEAYSQRDQDRYALFSSIFNISKEKVEQLEFFGMTKVTTPVEQIDQQLQKMRQLGVSAFIQKKLNALITAYCPDKKASVFLYPLDENDTYGRENLGGVSAFADYDGTLTFIVYPEKDVFKVLSSVITHEFHHFWRMGHLGITEENETLLDKLVLEGLAEHFVGKVLGTDRQGPYIRALTPDQAKILWKSAFYNQLELKGDATNLYMFGGKSDLPMWAGYSMGYHLVQWFHERHSHLTIEELTLLPSSVYVTTLDS
ncbi:MAG: DUF2268 domain-containing putative Zn-dependent protease [Tuberibacillus sp.]